MQRISTPMAPVFGQRAQKSARFGLASLVVVVAILLGLAFTAAGAYAQEPQPPVDRRADLGDAPDSTNHHGIHNTAYPGVPGRFPTVFDGAPAGEGRGPLHHHTDQVWLGDKITQEAEADLGPDQDKDGSGADLNNILNDGKDNANNDGGDDGWLRRDRARFPNCGEAELLVRVRKNPASQQTKVFLNVWFDGNRDGDWADRGPCEPDGHSNEWIVQNYSIDLTAFTGDFADIPVKTVLIYNEKPDQPAWIRFMLSDEEAVMPPQSDANPNPIPDGRGPDNGYNIGETEDYLVRFPDEPPSDLRADLGDAPDSTNHHGLPQQAYPGTPARFPTVWDVPATEVSGPKHADATIVWLGEKVSHEEEADRPPDTDPTTNITNNGADVTAMDQDRGDDGWLNIHTVQFPDCGHDELRVRVSDRPGVNAKMYLNVYFDGNRNGQWGERKECGPAANDPSSVDYGHEWIVQNFPIDTSLFNGTMEFTVPTMMIMNDHKDADAWVRFMLSEEPVTELAPFEHDGRGPHAPAMWQMGETEDYIWRPPLPPQDEAKPDLGDAPDSTNHHSLKQEAYPGVTAAFPTVWDVTAPDASGPKHRNAIPIRLGYHVSGEEEADKLPDEDGATNITDNGADAASMDKDEGDDGWLEREHTRFVDCEEARLKVRVSNLSLPSTPNGRRMFLNVWFDGNRNGQWGERKSCSDQPVEDRPDDFAHEWIVQNFVVVVPSTPSVHEYLVPTFKVLNERPNAAAWVRFTLSEEPIKALAPFQHDGRGPQAPAMWQLGETEDYLYTPPFDQGEPGEVHAVKSSSADGHAVALGEVFTYTVEIEHAGGSAPIQLKMSDPLPPEVALVGPPHVQVLTPFVSTAHLTYDPGVGPNGAILWEGVMDPNAQAAISFPVRLRRCPPGESAEIVNQAVIVARDGRELAKPEHRLKANCQVQTPPEVILEKHVVRDFEVIQPQEPGGAQEADAEVVRGQSFGYELMLGAKNLPGPQTFLITDTLPAGLVATGVQAGEGEAVIQDEGHAIRWRVRLNPEHHVARLRIQVRPTDKVLCGDRMINIAHWAAVVGDEIVARGQSNPAIIVLTCADLGDAPDSTNHAGVKMHAYPGVEAQFPTVFDPATGLERGPKHMVTWPMHLGKGVSEEMEADGGPDVDPTNNILPKDDKPNLDERDDGLVWEQLRFEECKVATIPVIVAIDPRVPAMLPDGEEAIGYLNVWLDSNRDGAWDDSYKCPGAEGQQEIVGWEHIVVDHPLNVRALGPGIHIIPVTTNWPVSWPVDFETRPAWLRVTLAERPSNKVLDCGGGTCHIGDGRGYDQPFGFGETEDHLYRQGRSDEPPTEGMDPAVVKKGHLQRYRDPRSGREGWLASWVVEYRNKGSVAATHVVLTDTLSGPQTLRREQAIPPAPHSDSGDSHIYSVGTLNAGAGGVILMESTLPITIAPGTVITNQVTITADHDDDLSNNTDVVTLTVPLLPPVITYPTPGTTCTGTFTVTGRVQPGATVDLTISDASGAAVVTATVTPDSNGHWSYGVSGLADGAYDVTAVAQYGSQTSGATTVHVIVDSTFFWNPMSLRFEDEEGHVILPRDSSGRMDGSGWRVFLRRGTLYTVTVRICCSDPNAQVTLDLGDFATITLTDPEGDGLYSATFTTPDTGPIQGVIRICVVCELIKVCSDGEVTIDPEGTVFDVTTGQAINAAQVACMVQEVSEASGEPSYSLWPAVDFDQINPQTTGADGYFSFFTPPGTYQLQVSKEGYQSYRSPDLVVVDKPVHYDVPLSPAVNEEAGVQVLITENGFEPSILKVEPDTVIEFINATSTLRGAQSITPTATYAGPARLKSTDAFDSGLLAGGESYKRQLTTEGTYTYVDPSNPAFSGAIIVEQTATTTEQKIFLPSVSR